MEQEADKFLQVNAISSILSKFGEFIYSGSYAYKLMLDRDIDITMKLATQTAEDFFQIGQELRKTLNPASMKFEDNFSGSNKWLPAGYYWGIKTAEGWKLDIWALPEADFFKQKLKDETIQAKLTADNRQLIMEIKRIYKLPDGHYENKVSSGNIYNAVLNDDVNSIEGFEIWLKENQFSKFSFIVEK